MHGAIAIAKRGEKCVTGNASSKTNGNGACCTREQMQKAKQSFGTFEDKLVHASLLHNQLAQI